MALKLFQVDVESFVLVLAEDAKKAEALVRDDGCHGDISHNLIEDSSVYAREVKTRVDLDHNWYEAEPYVSRLDAKNESNDDILNLTCGEIIEKWETEPLEKLRLKAEEERFDKLQMKLPLGDDTKEVVAVVCRSCGYSGAIDTYLPSASMYSDCRCPKCGSTNNDHNSGYATELCKALRELSKLGERADEICKKN